MSLSPTEQEDSIYNILWRRSRDEFLLAYPEPRDLSMLYVFSTDDLEIINTRTKVKYIGLVERGLIVNEFEVEPKLDF